MIPIVLHHGLLGGGMRFGPWRWPSFKGIDRALAEAGFAVTVAQVHPTAGIDTRAEQLRRHILQFRAGLPDPSQPIIIMAHSMGGLDARYMLGRMDMAPHIGTLLTIATPHRGSPVADWASHHLGRRLGVLHAIQSLGLDVRAAVDLTTERCARFNEDFPDLPGIRYFSVTTAVPRRRAPAFDRAFHALIERTEGPNDGLVSVKSATWGKHLLTWPANHWQSVNRKVGPRPNPDMGPLYVEAARRISGK